MNRKMNGTILAVFSGVLIAGASVDANGQLRGLLRDARGSIEDLRDTVEDTVDEVGALSEEVSGLADEVSGLVGKDETPTETAARLAAECESTNASSCEVFCSQAASLITPDMPVETSDLLLGQCRTAYNEAFAVATTAPPAASATAGAAAATLAPAPAATSVSAASLAEVPEEIIEQIANQCSASPILGNHYDCACVAEKARPIWVRVQNESLQNFNEVHKPYRQAQIDATRAQGLTESARQQEEQLAEMEREASNPSADLIQLPLYGGGEAASCLSPPKMSKFEFTQCMKREGDIMGGGMRVDSEYCECVGSSYADRLLALGVAQTNETMQAASNAMVSCNTMMPGD
jgi:hypothetical protein